MRLLLCGCLLVLAGCGGGDGPELPVSGVVTTLDGNPVADATVRFFPDSGTDPSSSGFAVTGTDGKFVVTGGKNKKGLVAGKYKVTVSKTPPQTANSEEGAGAVVETEVKDEFPPIYSDPTKTVLSYSVTGDGKPIEIKLDMKRKK
jgi:hypothetical protein